MTDKGNDRVELERLIRAGFERRAADVDTDVPVAARARAAARRRRGVRTGLTAVCVVSVVAVAAAVVDRANVSDWRGGPAAGSPTQGSDETPAWRTEYWHDLQVKVPADWGYGGAPMRFGGAESEVVACGAVATVSASGEKLRQDDPTMPYVGRPIAQTDLCEVYPWIGPKAVPPQSPYVWLGAAVEPGTVELGDGYVQETVQVNGSTVTVATQDVGLRRQILESAKAGGETCPSELDPNGTLPESMDPTATSELSMTVCVYRSSSHEESIQLAYATRLGSRAADAYLAALASAPPPQDCPYENGSESEWAVLEITRSAEVRLQHVVHLNCPGGIATAADALTSRSTVGLTPELVEPWAVQGTSAVLYGPTGSKGAMLDSFIGPQG
jgi:hypothetical protein